MYLDHINGKVDAKTRTANRPTTAYDQVVDSEDDDEDRSGTRGSKMSVLSGAVPDDSHKHDIPKECFLEMFKLNRIEEFAEDFILVGHPYP